MFDIEARVNRLLDRLEDPNLSDAEIAQLEKKIRFLAELTPPVVRQIGQGPGSC
jgi:hypothetical protein